MAAEMADSKAANLVASMVVHSAVLLGFLTVDQLAVLTAVSKAENWAAVLAAYSAEMLGKPWAGRMAARWAAE